MTTLSSLLVIIIAYTFVENKETQDKLDEIDNAFVWIYLGEVVIKIFGMGIMLFRSTFFVLII